MDFEHFIEEIDSSTFAHAFVEHRIIRYANLYHQEQIENINRSLMSEEKMAHLKGEEKIAIEFAEWIELSDWNYYPFADEWHNDSIEGNDRIKNISELFGIFMKEKNSDPR